LAISLDPAIGALIISGFALLFAAAASHKLRNIPEFAAVFAAYEIGPALARLKLYWLIPLFEVGVAVGLCLPATRVVAALSGLTLLIAYSTAIALNLRAGRTAIACGCGGLGRKSPIAAWMVWRNLGLALVLALALVPWSSRNFELTDGLTVVCGLATLGALYSCVERLFGYGESPLGGPLRNAP